MGHGTAVNANVTPASWAYTTEGVSEHPFDPEASAAALEAAGWELGDNGVRVKDGTEFAFTMTLYSYDQTLQQSLLVAQQNLEEIGVKMQVEMVEPGVFDSRRSDRSFDAVSRIWNPVYDPDQSGLLKTGNWYGYSNEEVDTLCDEAVATTDQEKRLPVYHELQAVVSEDLPNLWLYSENELHILAAGVEGLGSHPVNPFWNISSWTIS